MFNNTNSIDLVVFQNHLSQLPGTQNSQKQCLEMMTNSQDVFWVPKTSLRFGDLLEGLPGFNIQLSSQLRSLTAQGYKATSAKGEGPGGEVGGNQVPASTSPPPVGPHRTGLILPIEKCENLVFSTKEAH